MNLSNLSFVSKIFTILIIGVIYIIIFWILRIMHKDMKFSNKSKKTRRKKTYGLEIMTIKGNTEFDKGSVLPVNSKITIGRKKGNFLTLKDEYVSGSHAVITVKNDECVLEDLNSTNGTTVNKKKVKNEVYLKSGDIIQIGQSKFKVIS